MNYPFWDVPVIGGAWVIGAIAIFHVMISHFAIGGGLYLPLAEAKALREGRDDWMRALRAHAKFFLILTGVFGAVSGVGIWFSIGLANPEGTSALIHNFVFGWAIEWVFFTVELTAVAVYYYTWGRIPNRLHMVVGWVYAASAWLSLVIINGILTFMLTPGATWLAAAGDPARVPFTFWDAFFNPTYWPSLALRTLVCISLAGVWALVMYSRMDGEREGALKAELLRWSARWLLPAFVLMPLCFLWYLVNVPESQKDLLNLGISTIGQGTFTQVTRVALVTVLASASIVAVVYFLAYLHPREFRFGHGVAILGLALAATGATEYAREMLRKPYVIGDHMYSNGVRVSQVAKYNAEGYLKSSPWATRGAGLRAGRVMFLGQCGACHTLEGYRGMRGLLEGRDAAAVANIVKMLHAPGEDSPYRKFMPPLVGTDEEVAALAEYLLSLVPRREAHAQQAAVATPAPAR